MAYPDDLRYSKEHEWVRVDGSRATIGITSFAADELGDIVFVELPEVGRVLQPVRRLRRRREREGGQRPLRAGLRRGRRGQRGVARRTGAAELRSVRRGLDPEGRARRRRRARRRSWTPTRTRTRPPDGGDPMTYSPHTEADRARMLEAIGVDSVDDLFADIPAAVRAGAWDVPPPLDRAGGPRRACPPRRPQPDPGGQLPRRRRLSPPDPVGGRAR